MLSEYHVTGEDPHLGIDKDSGGDENNGDSEDDYTPDEIETMIQNVDTFNEVEQCNKEVSRIEEEEEEGLSRTISIKWLPCIAHKVTKTLTFQGGIIIGG